MIVCRSFTFKHHSVEELERIGAALPTANELMSLGLAAEAVRLSSCNRQEIYCVTNAPADFLALIDERVAAAIDSSSGAVFRGRGSVRHLFRVVSSIESMVVGENQIVRQVHRSETVAGADKTLGPILARLFLEARRVGRLVRSDTGIGCGAVSIASVAVDIAKGIFSDLSRSRVLVIGAGRMGGLAARHLVSSGATIEILAHRNRQRAEALAMRIGGTVVDGGNLASAARRADIIVGASGARTHVLTRELVSGIMPERRGRPLFLIDMANPRNIDPLVAELAGVYLYDLDDFEAVADRHRKERAGAVALAEEIISDAVIGWSEIERDISLRETVAAAYERLMEEERRLAADISDESLRRGLRIQLRRLFHRTRKTLTTGDPITRTINAAGFALFWGIDGKRA